MAMSERLILAMRLTKACNEHRRGQMWDHTVGPFTRVGFYHRRDGIVLERASKPDTRGVSIVLERASNRC